MPTSGAPDPRTGDVDDVFGRGPIAFYTEGLAIGGWRTLVRKLSKTQAAVMVWMSRGWKAYLAGPARVEVNGHPVGTAATMASLEKLGLVAKLGVMAWEATEAGKQWTARAPGKPSDRVT